MGFAWDVTGKGTTVFRGGGGLIYETVNWESLLAFNNSFGLSNVPTGAIISGTGMLIPSPLEARSRRAIWRYARRHPAVGQHY